MKVKTTSVVELEGIGIFKAVESWEIFTKYQDISGNGVFITIDEEKLGMDAFFGTLFKDDTLTIAFASKNISEKLKKIKIEKRS